MVRTVRVVLVAVAGLVLGACASGEVSAPDAGQPSLELTWYENNGCPVAFERVPIYWEDPRDENGDRTLCSLDVTTDDGVTRIYAVMDNFIPSGTFGDCPTNFVRQAYKIEAEGQYDPQDHNKNFQLCVFTNSAGRKVIVDDNVRASEGSK